MTTLEPFTNPDIVAPNESQAYPSQGYQPTMQTPFKQTNMLMPTQIAQTFIPPKPWYKVWWGILLLVFMSLIIVGAISFGVYHFMHSSSSHSHSGPNSPPPTNPCSGGQVECSGNCCDSNFMQSVTAGGETVCFCTENCHGTGINFCTGVLNGKPNGTCCLSNACNPDGTGTCLNS